MIPKVPQRSAFKAAVRSKSKQVSKSTSTPHSNIFANSLLKLAVEDEEEERPVDEPFEASASCLTKLSTVKGVKLQSSLSLWLNNVLPLEGPPITNKTTVFSNNLSFNKRDIIHDAEIDTSNGNQFLLIT